MRELLPQKVSGHCQQKLVMRGHGQASQQSVEAFAPDPQAANGGLEKEIGTNGNKG